MKIKKIKFLQIQTIAGSVFSIYGSELFFSELLSGALLDAALESSAELDSDISNLELEARISFLEAELGKLNVLRFNHWLVF